MGKVKWTPGPWEIRTRGDGSKSITGAYHYTPGNHPWAGGILLVCELSNDKHFGEANARLISAAPDLYEALTLLRGVRSIDQLTSEQFKTIDAALAKARGETP